MLRQGAVRSPANGAAPGGRTEDIGVSTVQTAATAGEFQCCAHCSTVETVCVRYCPGHRAGITVCTVEPTDALGLGSHRALAESWPG